MKTTNNKNNLPQIFNFNDHEVRTISNNGQTWFVANDIAAALGYTNPREALNKHVDKEDSKGVTIRDTLGKNPQTMNVMNESGMYSLVLSSKKQEAKKFKRWVTNEVLPKIRQTGTYAAGQPVLELPATERESIVSFGKIDSRDLALIFDLDHDDLFDKIKQTKRFLKDQYVGLLEVNFSIEIMHGAQHKYCLIGAEYFLYFVPNAQDKKYFKRTLEILHDVAAKAHGEFIINMLYEAGQNKKMDDRAGLIDEVSDLVKNITSNLQLEDNSALEFALKQLKGLKAENELIEMIKATQELVKFKTQTNWDKVSESLKAIEEITNNMMLVPTKEDAKKEFFENNSYKHDIKLILH